MMSALRAIARAVVNAVGGHRVPQARLQLLRVAAVALQTAVPKEPITSGEPSDRNAIEDLVAQGWRTFGDEIAHLRHWAAMRNEASFFPASGMYDWIESQILYLLIRQTRPSVIVEISPNFGYSTGIMLLALNANRRGQLRSYDLNDRFVQQARRNFVRAGIDASRQRFFAGDVRENLVEVPENIDLLFMDSDHSVQFARWYIAELFPRVRRGGLIHAHDILRYGVKPHLGDQGEGEELAAFIRDRALPENSYLYVSDLVRRQPLSSEPIRSLQRYPFGGASALGSNNVEQNASLWMISG